MKRLTKDPEQSWRIWGALPWPFLFLGSSSLGHDQQGSAHCLSKCPTLKSYKSGVSLEVTFDSLVKI